MAAEAHVGQVGLRIPLAFVKEDGSALELDTVDEMWLDLSPPTGAVISRQPSIQNPPGLDGLAEYFTVAGDLHVEGDWVVQGYVTTLSGQVFYSDQHTLPVRGNLKTR